MSILALDLGGTKLASAVFSESGELIFKEATALDNRKGKQVGQMILDKVANLTDLHRIVSIGVSVPGISRQARGTVWAPNIDGWEDYPLLEEIQKLVGDDISVAIDSDRACSIFGEQWQGNGRNFKDIIFIAVGTGIGAGIISGGHLIRGSHDIAGAIGWMALPKPFESKYVPCGCFEFYASGAGIPRFTKEVLQTDPSDSSLRAIHSDQLTAQHVFEAFDRRDPIAEIVVKECISYWGMAAANLVSIFNPQKIIFGGGIFGPAAKFLGEIKAESSKWAQPISITQVEFEQSKLGGDAAVYGAGFIALKNSIIPR